MTSPFDIIRPAGAGIPLVLDSPHSGTQYPEDFEPAVPRELLRQAEDSFVDELYASGPSLGATLIAARFPRSYIDPNRSLLDIDTSLLDAPWPGPAAASRKTQLGIGLIWRVLDTGEPIYARRLSVAASSASCATTSPTSGRFATRSTARTSTSGRFSTSTCTPCRR
jgi:N-formylglutamate deformylase